MLEHKSSETWAVVTGASSGIGLSYSKILASLDYNLILISRRQPVLEDLAVELRQQYGIEVVVFAKDLSVLNDLVEVEKFIASHNGIDLLVNNAGIGDICQFVEADRNALTQMINVNVVALTRLTHSVLPAMLKRKEGAVINVSSGFAFNSMDIGVSVYAGSKSYVAHFTEVLSEELKGSGIKFQALIPGLTRTNLGGAEESGLFQKFPPSIVMEPDVLVKASLAGLALNEVICIPRLEDVAIWEEVSLKLNALGRQVATGDAIVASRYRISR